MKRVDTEFEAKFGKVGLTPEERRCWIDGFKHRGELVDREVIGGYSGTDAALSRKLLLAKNRKLDE